MRPPPIPPRVGPNRRSSDPGRKARAYPAGAGRGRLRLILRAPTLDEAIASWLTASDHDAPVVLDHGSAASIPGIEIAMAPPP